MPEILLNRARPQSADDLPPNTRPVMAVEKDQQIGVRGRDGGLHARDMRVRQVLLVDREDANKRYIVAKVIGPATGEDAVMVPAEGEVEMAQILEMLAQAVENRRARSVLRALWLPQRHAQLQEGLVQVAHELIEQKAGRSVSGPHFTRERSSR